MVCAPRKKQKICFDLEHSAFLSKIQKKNLEPKHRFHTYFSSKFPLLNNKDS